MERKEVNYGNIKVRYEKDIPARTVGKKDAMQYSYSHNGHQWYSLSEEVVEALVKARSDFALADLRKLNDSI